MKSKKNIAAALKSRKSDAIDKTPDVSGQKLESSDKASKRRHPKKDNNLLQKPSGLKFQFLRVVSVMMIISMLVTSNPAAPQSIAASAGEMIQDVRFSYMVNSGYISELGANLVKLAINTNPVLGFFFAKKGKRQASIATIKVLPKTSVIKEGSDLVLNAIASIQKAMPFRELVLRGKA